MSDSKTDPQTLVASQCIALSESLLTHRRASLSNSDATRAGEDLFSWFRGVGAITDANAGIAARSVDLGIALLQKSTTATIGEVVTTVQNTYQHYASR
ncbi:MAG: hypothetical protein IAE82_00335 [Opitutaceae bacterium]|nr:hypothetical protein [Opitutaceae bacterium]